MTRSLDAAIQTGLDSLETNSSKFKYPDNIIDCNKRLPNVIRAWEARTGEDNKTFERAIPEVECVFAFGLDNVITGRLDSLLIRGKELFFGEIKTTSWSLQAALDTLQYNDQMTLYTQFARNWAEANDLTFVGGLVDVLYSRGSVVEARREPFHRSQEQIGDYLSGATATLNEIEVLKDTVREGWNLAPKCYRNPNACEFCPYGVICAGHRVQTLDELAQTPAGFTKVE